MPRAASMDEGNFRRQGSGGGSGGKAGGAQWGGSRGALNFTDDRTSGVVVSGTPVAVSGTPVAVANDVGNHRTSSCMESDVGLDARNINSSPMVVDPVMPTSVMNVVADAESGDLKSNLMGSPVDLPPSTSSEESKIISLAFQKRHLEKAMREVLSIHDDSSDAKIMRVA